MKQITVRNVAERSVAQARELARQRGVSLNQVFVEALDSGLGLGAEQRRNGLEKFASDSDFGPDWDDYLTGLRQVNPDDWR